MTHADPKLQSKSLFGRDLQDPRWMWLKAALFLLLGGVSAGVLAWRLQGLWEITLLAVAVWSFCRLYYFAFYVIEHYVDPGYRFDGLLGFLRYVVTRRGRGG